jgi:hypothetical protein
MAGDLAGPRSVRYPAIDVLRALALVSMVSTHLTSFRQTAVFGRLLHSARWVDGAFFFVALSGVVTGLVHRRLVERRGVRASAVKLTRRAGFLYVIHVALAFTVVFAYSAYRSPDVLNTPTLVESGGWAVATHIVSLALEPNYNNILPMYVVFLLWAVVAVGLLHRRLWWAVVGVSIAVYVVGQRLNGLALSPDGFQIAGWQLLFTGGLLVGWTWEHERTQLSLVARRGIVIAAFVASLAMYAAARLSGDTIQAALGLGLGKLNGGWVAFLYSAAILVAGYALVERLRTHRLVAVALRPVAVLGSKGLPGYVTMVLVILALDFMPAVPRNDLTLIGVVVICGVAEFVAVRTAPLWHGGAVRTTVASRLGGVLRRRVPV